VIGIFALSVFGSYMQGFVLNVHSLEPKSVHCLDITVYDMSVPHRALIIKIALTKPMDRHALKISNIIRSKTPSI